MSAFVTIIFEHYIMKYRGDCYLILECEVSKYNVSKYTRIYFTKFKLKRNFQTNNKQLSLDYQRVTHDGKY